MKIRHEDGREVDVEASIVFNGGEKNGVRVAPARSHRYWSRDGTRYYPEDGWSEVKEPVTRDATGEVEIDRGPEKHDLTMFRVGGKFIDGDPAYFFRKVQRYDLPGDWWDRWLKFIPSGCTTHNIPGFKQFIEQFQKPCIIIEKTE